MTTQDQPIKVLLIINPKEQVTLIRELLNESPSVSYEVDHVSTYEDGIARLRRGEHDACLMDDHVEASLDGLAVLHAMARHGGRVPVMLLLDSADPAAAREAREAGAVDAVALEELTDNILERSVSLLDRLVRHAMARRKADDALRASQERLIEAELRKDEMLAMLAHELRNPLAPIRYALQTLRLDARQGASPPRQWEMIDRQVRQMGHLLDDLLDVSRLTRGKINLQKSKVDLGEVVERAVDSLRPLVRDYGQELIYTRLEEPLWMQGDAVRLEQSIRNILHNAIKFTKHGGRIWLGVERENGTLPMATVRVVDSGIGIEPELLPRIFDLFTQTGHSLNRAQGGLGVGLTMVKHMMRMHGGGVRAHSAGLGKGSEFVIQLPLLEPAELGEAALKPAAHPGAEGLEGATPATRPRRVLVVEDNQDSANSLGELIELWGHETRVVNDGPAAIEAATAFHPEIVLLDIGLPGMNGYQVARIMRSRPALRGALLVALTGFGQEEDRACAEQAGFDRHFTKPVEIDALQTLLQKAA